MIHTETMASPTGHGPRAKTLLNVVRGAGRRQAEINLGGEKAKMDGLAKPEVKRRRYREFTVTPGMCGFKVRIGCCELYFDDAGALAAEITDYLDDPQQVERKFLENDARRVNEVPGPCDPTTKCTREGPQGRL